MSPLFMPLATDSALERDPITGLLRPKRRPFEFPTAAPQAPLPPPPDIQPQPPLQLQSEVYAERQPKLPLPPTPPMMDQPPAPPVANPPLSLPATDALQQAIAQGPPKLSGFKGVLQRLGAAGLGAAAGYVNAGGRVHIDPNQVQSVQRGIMMPGYDQKMGQLAQLSKMEQERLGTDLNVQNVQSQIAARGAQAESEKAQVELYRAQAQRAKSEPTRYQVSKDGLSIFDRSTGQWITAPKSLADQIKENTAAAKAAGIPEGTPEFIEYTLTGKYTKPVETVSTSFQTDDKGNVTAVGVDKKGNVVSTNPVGPIGKSKTASTLSLLSPDDPKQIAQGIVDGTLPPDLGQYSRFIQGAVAAELKRTHDFDLVKAQREWSATKRWISTLNGPQQERLTQAINFTYETIPLLESAFDEWKNSGATTGMRIFNKATLAAAKQLPGQAGASAQKLELLVTDFVNELSQVYRGGYAPTNESLQMADKNLRADWNEQTFKQALGTIKKVLVARRNAVNMSSPRAVESGSPYMKGLERNPIPGSGSPETVKTWNPKTGKFE